MEIILFVVTRLLPLLQAIALGPITIMIITRLPVVVVDMEIGITHRRRGKYNTHFIRGGY